MPLHAPPNSNDTAFGHPAFLITIDTEGDHVWSRPRTVTTRNALFLPRFQSLCERYGLRPTWLTNWEMVECPIFREFGRDVVRRDAGEIGMHLHAWNSPPLQPLTADDSQTLPYLTHFPASVMRQKVRAITDRLEDTFGVRMLSHRAGRWAFNETYARILIEHGYQVDCSVTPHVQWHHGVLDGGLDYRAFPDREYCLDPDCIHREARGSALLELPMTVLPRDHSYAAVAARRLLSTTALGRRIRSRLLPDVDWLRPDGRRFGHCAATLRRALAGNRPYVEFMLHSSELMPGGSPRFPTERHIERLYDELDELFDIASQHCDGLTLTEYRNRTVARTRHEAGCTAPEQEPALTASRRAG